MLEALAQPTFAEPCNTFAGRIYICPAALNTGPANHQASIAKDTLTLLRDPAFAIQATGRMKQPQEILRAHHGFHPALMPSYALNDGKFGDFA
jgi:hypothetical protein